MPNKAKQPNPKARIKDKDLNSNYNCKDCNEIVHYKYTTCPRCGYFHQTNEARNSNPIIK
jgi:predicted ATP-dependent serine protease